MRNASDDRAPSLGELELEVLHFVWRLGPCAAETVRERLNKPLKESTIRTVLRRLEEKGFVTHTVETRTYLYSAAQPRRRVAARSVQAIVDWFCNGSVEELLTGMVDSNVLTRKELTRLAAKIAEAKGEKK